VNSSVIHSSAATWYQTLTYNDSTLRLTSVYSTGPMMQTKPTTMNMPICHGISRYSMPSVQPAPMAPMALAMAMLMNAPPSITQGAPNSRVRSRRGSSQTMRPSAALVIQP
jgi:hypothetical protein